MLEVMFGKSSDGTVSIPTCNIVSEDEEEISSANKLPIEKKKRERRVFKKSLKVVLERCDGVEESGIASKQSGTSKAKRRGKSRFKANPKRDKDCYPCLPDQNCDGTTMNDNNNNHEKCNRSRQKKPEEVKQAFETTNDEIISTSTQHGNRNRFACAHCNKCFPTSGQLKRHLISHSSVRPFSCAECSKTFKRKHTLVAHVLTHTSARPFDCGVCGAQFKSKRDLKLHRVVHQVKKPFACKTCGSSFKDARRLKRHSLSHLDLRPFVCKVCAAAFKYAYALTKHCAGKHANEKRFVCNTCQAAFSILPSLKAHLLVHSAKQFRCDVCQKEFRHKRILRNHVQLHLRQK